jgi:hypothetical protein
MVKSSHLILFSFTTAGWDLLRFADIIIISIGREEACSVVCLKKLIPGLVVNRICFEVYCDVLFGMARSRENM